MKQKLPLLLACLLTLLPIWAIGQEGALIQGVVTSDRGDPLPGANVFLQNTTYGSATDPNGAFSIRVPAAVATGQQMDLVAKLIGYRTKTVRLRLTSGTITQNFVLAEDVLELEGVVVTGLGETIKEKLGVSIAKVKPELVTQADQSNVVTALSGKVSNVEITKTSGDAGTNTYIRIRGGHTIDRGNQPLFVIDGSPVSNQTLYTAGANGGTEAQNRASDINVEDIESIEVLKGAAASAIYGSRASNGVILVTTKSGKPGRTKISYKGVVGFSEQSEFYPLQTWFGQGTAGAFRKDFARTWGAPLNVPGAPHFDASKPVVEVFDHSREITGNTSFLGRKGGFNNENNVTISGGNDYTTFFLSLGRLNEQGHWIGGSFYERYTARVKASQVLSAKFKLTGNVAYAHTDANYLQRGDNAIGLQLGALRTPPEFNNLPYLHPTTGYHRSYRYSDATLLRRSRNFDNPFFIMNEHENPAILDRLYGNAKIEYDLLDWVKLDYTFGTDYYTDDRDQLIPISSSDAAGLGLLTRTSFFNQELDGNLVVTIRGDKFLNKYRNIDATLMLGHNINSRKFKRFEVTGQDMGIPGFNQLDNTVSTNLQSDEFESLVHTESYFGQATVDLYNQLYLTGAVRNEGSSTFGKSQKRHWYPKFSAAWDFTKFKTIPFVDFGKLRLAYGEAGVQPGVYSVISGFSAGSKGFDWSVALNPTYRGIKGYFSDGNQGNDDVKPERTKEIEGGTNLAFWNSRIGLDLTFYRAKSTDVLFDLNLVPATGFFSYTANAAVIENKGWEITLDVNPIRKRNFSWTVGFNFATNDNKVLEMGGVTLADIQRDPTKDIFEQIGRWAYASPGRPLGAMRLQSWVRFGYGSSVTEGGQLVEIDKKYSGWKKGDVYVTANGKPIMSTTNYPTDFHPNPDWTGGLRNEFKLFNNLTVSALLDIKQGFEIMNHGKGALYDYGTHKDTEVRGQSGPIDRWFRHGEKAIGPGAGKEFVYDQTFFQSLASGFSGDGWLFTEDGSFVRLREIAVGYTLKNNFISRIGLSDVNFRLSARNLKTWTKYTGYDPESNRRQATDERDSDYFNQPQTRSYTLTFYVNY
jgi:TonB-linked SusC/RagA family outer membrane protein